jgi:hypothetical protein
MTTPRLPSCPGLRRLLLRLPFVEWRKLLRLVMIHRMGVNAAAKRLGMNYMRAARIERLAMAALEGMGVDRSGIIPSIEQAGG